MVKAARDDDDDSGVSGSSSGDAGAQSDGLARATTVMGVKRERENKAFG